MARARSSSNSSVEQSESQDAIQNLYVDNQQLNLTETFLCGDSFLSSSTSPAEQQVIELDVNHALSQQNLIKEQESDSELQSLGQYAVSEKEADIVPNYYFWKEGVLMRKWRSPEVPASVGCKALYQIVLPQKYRSTVLSLAHETPMADHLGVKKLII